MSSSTPLTIRSSVQLALAATVLVAAALGATPAAAYVRSTTTNTNAPLKWMKTNCVYLRVNSNGSDDVNDGSDVLAAKRSVNDWLSTIGGCSYLKFVLLDDSPDAKIEFTRSGTNENAVVFQEKAWGHDEDAAAITTVFFLEKDGSDQDGRILDADIELNGVYFHFSSKGQPGRTDIENTVTHELGHVMGLDHPCDDGTRQPVPVDHTGATIPKCSVIRFATTPAAIEMRQTTMYNFAEPGETLKRDPEQDDIQGICDIYPLADDPGQCAPVSYGGGDTGCAVARGPAAPHPGALLLLGLLLLGLVARRS